MLKYKFKEMLLDFECFISKLSVKAPIRKRYGIAPLCLYIVSVVMLTMTKEPIFIYSSVASIIFFLILFFLCPFFKEEMMNGLKLVYKKRHINPDMYNGNYFEILHSILIRRDFLLKYENIKNPMELCLYLKESHLHLPANRFISKRELSQIYEVSFVKSSEELPLCLNDEDVIKDIALLRLNENIQ